MRCGDEAEFDELRGNYKCYRINNIIIVSRLIYYCRITYYGRNALPLPYVRALPFIIYPLHFIRCHARTARR